MSYALAFALILIWTLIPNLILLLATRDEGSHLFVAAGAFIPWCLLGLHLVETFNL